MATDLKSKLQNRRAYLRRHAKYPDLHMRKHVKRHVENKEWMEKAKQYISEWEAFELCQKSYA